MDRGTKNDRLEMASPLSHEANKPFKVSWSSFCRLVCRDSKKKRASVRTPASHKIELAALQWKARQNLRPLLLDSLKTERIESQRFQDGRRDLARLNRERGDRGRIE